MAQLIHLIFLAFEFLLLARILISWAQLDPYHPVAQFLYRATEPFLAPVRKVVPPAGMFDLSPIVVLIIAFFLEQILTSFFRG